MFKRKIVIQTLVTAAVLLTIGINDLWAIDIDRIEIIFQKGFEDGVPETPLPWGFEIYAFLSIDTFLDHINVTRVGETYPFATMWPTNQPGQWEWVSPGSLYETYSDLRSAYPDATFKFDFLTYDDVPLQSVSIDVSNLPGEPANPVEFTFPSFNLQGVRPDSTFTWDVSRNDGDTLMMSIFDEESLDADLYYDTSVSINTTSWKPGPLPAGLEKSLSVSVCNVKDWGKGKVAYPTMIDGGDEFEYALMVEYYNSISFQTLIIDIITETITNKTRSITCHIWPIGGHDVTEIYLPSIYLFDDSLLVNGIAPSSISVNNREQMLEVKFPIQELGPFEPGPLLLTVKGAVGAPPEPEYIFIQSDFVDVIEKGGKPN